MITVGGPDDEPGVSDRALLRGVSRRHQLTPATWASCFPTGLPTASSSRAIASSSIDGDPIETFYDLTRIVERSAGKPLRFGIERAGRALRRDDHAGAPTSRSCRSTSQARVGRIGIVPQHPLAVIGVTSPTSPAAAARLRTFDVVIAAGGRPIERFIDLERVLSRNQGTLVPLSYLRPTPVPNALGGLVRARRVRAARRDADARARARATRSRAPGSSRPTCT